MLQEKGFRSYDTQNAHVVTDVLERNGAVDLGVDLGVDCRKAPHAPFLCVRSPGRPACG